MAAGREPLGEKALTLFCCFCGGRLTPPVSRDEPWACGGCRARFRAAHDRDGCVITLDVAECGSPQCCRINSNAGKQDA